MKNTTFSLINFDYIINVLYWIKVGTKAKGKS